MILVFKNIFPLDKVFFLNGKRQQVPNDFSETNNAYSERFDTEKYMLGEKKKGMGLGTWWMVLYLSLGKKLIGHAMYFMSGWSEPLF